MSNLKKIVALVLAMALVMTMFAGAAIKTDLSKFVDGEEFTEAQKDALALVNAVGIIEGVSENEIGAASLTRAQLVKVLYVLSNGTTEGASKYVAPVFSDVAAGNWAAGYIAWAYLKGVVNGVSATEFAPDAKVTPLQAAAMLARLFDANACKNPETFNQDAQAAAIKYGFTDGITTLNFFADKEISRGDMFIMIANALTYEYKTGKSLLTEVFGVEKIEGAILLGVEKQYYKASAGGRNTNNAYSVFAFRWANAGDVTYFATDLLCVEDDADIDDIGCKYTLYVSADKTYNGFRKLFAAYEMDDNYYDVREGTVDDGKLIFAPDKKQNVFFDKNVVVYVNGEVKDSKGVAYGVEDFVAYYNVANKATYKLIDNDGDGYVEYAFINLFVLADIKGEWIVGNVTGYNKGNYAINGTEYKFGEYWVIKDKVATLVSKKDIAAKFNAFLGTNYVAISNVQYKFFVADGYVFDVKPCDETQFFGSYGVVIDNMLPSVYKNMFYYTFINEQNEVVSAYVDKVNNAEELLDVDELVYFTNWNEAGDVCSVFTADFELSNYTFSFGEKAFDLGTNTVEFVEKATKVDLASQDLSKLSDKELANLYFVADEGCGAKKLYYRSYRKFADVEAEGYIAKYNALMDANDEDVEFFNLTLSKASVSATINDIAVDQIQIYRQNGFWGYRFFGEVEDIVYTLTVGNKSYNIYRYHGDWYYGIDGDDPYTTVGDKYDTREKAKKLLDREFMLYVSLEEVMDEFESNLFGGRRHLYAFTNQNRNIDMTYGVVFMYGRLSNASSEKVWRAYKASDVNADFGVGVYNDDLMVADQVIWTELNGTKYVKAAAITSSSKFFDVLPSGWIAKEDAALVVYGGMTGNYSANGWQITVYGENFAAQTAWCNVGLGGINVGDLLLVYQDENGVIVDIVRITENQVGTVEFLGGVLVESDEGKLVKEGVISGFDRRGNYWEHKYNTTCVIYVVDADKIATAYDTKWNGKDVTVLTAGAITVVYVGGELSGKN